ncbi:MAG: hypothetical protein AB1726_09600 [Planctomycetota bacterium]
MPTPSRSFPLHAARAALLLLPVLAGPALAQGEDLARSIDDLRRRVEELSARVGDLAAEIDPAGGAGVPAARLVAYGEHAAMAERSAYRSLEWQFLGPTNISGRITDVAVCTPRGKTYTIYAAAASGGVWKTENEGVDWKPVFEQGPTMSIGDVTLAPSNQEIVWIGTGEANIFRSSMAGCGVYKSTDGGASWRHMGLAATHTIPRIAIHPTNPDVVYVAASGHEWTDNPERGVYRTRDGGSTWELVFHVGDQAGAIDLVVDPSRPETLYAATWQRRRKLWNDPRCEPEHDGSSIWRTRDGGDTWQEIAAGLPPANVRGRIGIDLCQSAPNVLYAFLDNYELAEAEGETDSYGRERAGGIKGAEIYRSDDQGDTWRKASESNAYTRRASATYGWVFGQVRADPVDPNKVYMLGLALNVSVDGGRTFSALEGMHGDHHALWIDRDNPAYLVNGNDGGLVISYDAGRSWRDFNANLPVAQFYNVAYDMAEPFHVYGSIQDHGSRVGIVDLRRGRTRISPVEFDYASGGEASYHQVDPTDPNTLYYENFYGSIAREDLAAGEHADLMPKPPAGEEPYRGQWLAPFLISPHNPRILYHGLNRLFRSLDRGEGFAPVSPDLTTNDPARRGDIPYQTITTIAESPLRFGLLYVGTDDGRLHVTRDGGETWTEIVEGLAAERWFSRVEASRFAEGTVYAAQNGKRNDDFTPYVWRSTDYGRTWASIAAGIPRAPINVVREDPENPRILYVGTDLGVYVTTDGAETWEVLAAGLPATFVHDLVVHPRDDVVVIATHGRGMWVLDARPIRGEPEEEEPAPPRRRGRRGRGGGD